MFVGGLRESEDAVHITEEELATYFSKFGVVESVSINRDDRTHRGRGFAFVKFFQEVRRRLLLSLDMVILLVRQVPCGLFSDVGRPKRVTSAHLFAEAPSAEGRGRVQGRIPSKSLRLV